MLLLCMRLPGHCLASFICCVTAQRSWHQQTAASDFDRPSRAWHHTRGYCTVLCLPEMVCHALACRIVNLQVLKLQMWVCSGTDAAQTWPVGISLSSIVHHALICTRRVSHPHLSTDTITVPGVWACKPRHTCRGGRQRWLLLALSPAAQPGGRQDACTDSCLLLLAPGIQAAPCSGCAAAMQKPLPARTSPGM